MNSSLIRGNTILVLMCHDTCENFSAGKVLVSIFFGSRRHPPHSLSSKGPKCERRVLLISAGAVEGHFEGKTPREYHYGGLVLAQQCPGSPGTCDPEETAYLGFQYLDNLLHSPDLAPSDYHLFPGLKKTIESSPFFFRRRGQCCRGELVGWKTY